MVFDLIVTTDGVTRTKPLYVDGTYEMQGPTLKFQFRPAVSLTTPTLRAASGVRNGNRPSARPRNAPRLSPIAGIPTHGHRDTRPRHRRHDGDLHRAECGAPQATPVSEPAGSL